MFELFYEVAEYANENWRGKMSPREVAVNAYVYTIEMEYSLKHEEMSRTLCELLNQLKVDSYNGSETAAELIDRIMDVYYY